MAVQLPQQFPFRMLTGTTLDGRLDVPCWGVYVSNYTSQWVEIPDANEFVPPNTRQVIALPGVRSAKALFKSPDGITQPAAVATQKCLLTYTERVVQPSGGVVGASSLTSVVLMELFTHAGLPAAGTQGRLAKLTDYDRGLWKDTGTNWASVEGEVFDVKQFGALGLGVASTALDTAAFQAVIAELTAAGGGWVRIPPGTYDLSAFMTWPANTLVFGAGMGITRIRHGNGLTGVGNLFLGGDRCLFTNFTIDGNAPNNAAFAFSELALVGAQAAAHRIEILNWRTIAIDGGSTPDGLVSDCRIIGNGAASIDGGGAVVDSQWCVWSAAAGSRMRIIGSVLKDTSLGPIFCGGRTIILGNHVEGGHRSTNPSGGGQIADGAAGMVIARGNYIGAGGGIATSGFELNNESIVEGNEIEAQGAFGVILQAATGAGHIIKGNTIKDPPAAGAFRDGVRVSANVNDFTIEGNTISDTQGVPVMAIGVNVLAGTSDRYEINGNRVRGAVTSLFDGGTGTDKQIVGNVPRSAEAWIAFTPALAQNGAVAATVSLARYRIIGKIAEAQIRLVATAAGAAGFAVQITGIPAILAAQQTANYTTPGGGVSLFGAAFYTLSAVWNGATILQFLTNALGNFLGVTPNQAIAVGDQFALDLKYELA